MKVFIFKKKYLVVVLIILILIVFFLLKDNSTFALSLSKGEILSASFKDKFASICKSDEKVVYLTFDDGPTPEITSWVLDELKKYNAKATFFCIGKNVEQHPDLFNHILAQEHAIGNHTYNHLNGWETKSFPYLKDVVKCSKVFQSTLFRPPYGKLTRFQAKAILSDYTIIMWDVLSADFDKN